MDWWDSILDAVSGGEGVEEFIDPGSVVPAGLDATSGGFGQSLIDALQGLTPGQIGMLIGAGGPLAGLIGNLASGGQGPTQSGTSNLSGFSNQSASGTQSGSQSGSTSGTSSQAGTSTTNQTGTTDQTGFSNQTQTPQLNPAAQSAIDRLTSMITGQSGAAGQAYTSGLGMMEQLAREQLGPGGGGAGRPNTTPSPAAVTGFPTELPTTYNPGIGNLIKQAFGGFTGDIASSAITNARGRGFAGGADLLGTAAAPIAGPALARMPAEMANAYLNHVLQAYTAQGNVAAQKAGAESGALNAATNALGPGVQTYGIDRQADNQKINSVTSLLQALMGPNRDLMNANLGMINAIPHGSTNNTLSGSRGTSTLSGTTNSASAGSTTGQSNSQNQSQSQSNSAGQTGQSGATSGTSTAPLGNVIGTGVGNIIGGGATGFAAADPNGAQNQQNRSLLSLLLKNAGKA